MLRYMLGVTDEDRQVWRDQVLGTTAADFVAFADRLDRVVDGGSVAVIASERAIAEANGDAAGGAPPGSQAHLVKVPTTWRRGPCTPQKKCALAPGGPLPRPCATSFELYTSTGSYQCPLCVMLMIHRAGGEGKNVRGGGGAGRLHTLMPARGAENLFLFSRGS